MVTAYAHALAPGFWYLISFIGVALARSLLLKQIPRRRQSRRPRRSHQRDEAKRLEAEHVQAQLHATFNGSEGLPRRGAQG